jgi:Flp pilus assembly protein TadD
MAMLKMGLVQSLVWTILALVSLSKQGLAAEYVGTPQCIECHQQEYDQWQGSHHDMAMSHMSDDAVQGDFNNAELEFNGKTHRFFRRGDQYWVNIEGPDGAFHDYEITYTFGFEPLQQYMTEFDDGRVQLIPFAWDTRSREQGGQRWFHLYPNMSDPSHDFYWTNVGQNWNYMCADCHSTDLKKNYDVSTNTYATSWLEINVGCEACHGPASDHMQWAELDKSGLAIPDALQAHAGFNRNLDKAVSQWLLADGEGTLHPESIQATDQVTVCAQCHSRRTQISDSADHVQGVLSDRYRLNLLEPALYHADGQIFDEDYVYGSFLQSAMAENGVVCSNCHNPHTAQLAMPEEVVCSQCHMPTHYNDEIHSRHEVGSEEAMCTSCHMPETTYMQVDPRRDHSWQVPRPDLSLSLGTPNVCVTCHQPNDPKQDDQWAYDTLKQWFPDSRYLDSDHFAQGFTAGEQGVQQAESQLSYIAQNKNEAAIIRASALERLTQYPSQNSLVAVARGAKDPNELIRVGAVTGAELFPVDVAWRVVSPLLEDDVLAVRVEAAASLSRFWQQLTPAQKQQLQPALNEYIDVQHYNSDRAAGRVSLGNVYVNQGRLDEAEQAYLGAIMVEPYSSSGYVNLADLYRVQKKDLQAQQLFDKGIAAGAADSTLHYAYGLNLVRQQAYEGATEQLKQAAELDPQNAQYWYVLGLASRESDKALSVKALGSAYQLTNNPQYLYALCDVMIDAKHSSANRCLQQLQKVAPQEAVNELRAKQ